MAWIGKVYDFDRLRRRGGCRSGRSGSYQGRGSHGYRETFGVARGVRNIREDGRLAGIGDINQRYALAPIVLGIKIVAEVVLGSEEAQDRAVRRLDVASHLDFILGSRRRNPARLALGAHARSDDCQSSQNGDGNAIMTQESHWDMGSFLPPMEATSKV